MAEIQSILAEQASLGESSSFAKSRSDEDYCGPIDYAKPLPVTGAWLSHYPSGNRKFTQLNGFTTESKFEFPQVQVAYETWGRLNADKSNAIYISHAFTGDSHVFGSSGPGHLTAGWWDWLNTPSIIDTNKWFVVCANVLGGCQGTTGPSSIAADARPYGSRFPIITIGDMVRVEAALSEFLGIEQWALMIGPSLGGMRVLEWLVEYPNAVDRAILLGSPAKLNGDQIGLHETQIRAITLDPNYSGGDYYTNEIGPSIGMGIARRIAHLSYRSAAELNSRFSRDTVDNIPVLNGGTFSVGSYLDHHANKLNRRFDANTYIALTQAMSSFDLGTNRGSAEAALNRILASVTVGAIDSDRLFPMAEQEFIVDCISDRAKLKLIRSDFGHDGFLIEKEQVGKLIAETLETPSRF